MNFITHNAYGILGLSPNATSKEIQKRSRDIENLLKIDEMPKYTLDFDNFDKIRSVENTKEAMQNLLNSKTKLMHYFFSIYIENEDEKVSFAEKAKTQLLNVDLNTKNFMDKKNLAIFTYFSMFGGEIYVDSKSYLNLWREVLQSENLARFKNAFRNDDDFGVDEGILKELSVVLKDEVIRLNLSLIDSIKEQVSKIEFIKNLITLLEPKDEFLMQIKFINKRFADINKQSQNIKNSMKKDEIKMAINEFETNLKKLENIGLQTHTHTMIIKDKIAKDLQNKSIKFWNDKKDGEFAEFLSNKALQFCGSEFEKDKIKRQIQDLRKARENEKRNKEINVLLKRANECVDDENWREVDEVANKMRMSENDELTDQIAIRIGNNAIKKSEQILIQNQVSQYDDFNTKTRKIRMLISAFETLNSSINRALKYVKKQQTKIWLNQHKIQQSEINKLQNIINQTSGYFRPNYNPSNQGCLLQILIFLIIVSTPIILIANS